MSSSRENQAPERNRPVNSFPEARRESPRVLEKNLGVTRGTPWFLSDPRFSLSNREIRERWAKSPKVLAANGINAKSRERVLSAWCVNSGVGQFRGRKRSSPCETLFELNLQRSLGVIRPDKSVSEFDTPLNDGGIYRRGGAAPAIDP